MAFHKRFRFTGSLPLSWPPKPRNRGVTGRLADISRSNTCPDTLPARLRQKTIRPGGSESAVHAIGVNLELELPVAAHHARHVPLAGTFQDLVGKAGAIIVGLTVGSVAPRPAGLYAADGLPSGLERIRSGGAGNLSGLSDTEQPPFSRNESIFPIADASSQRGFLPARLLLSLPLRSASVQLPPCRRVTSAADHGLSGPVSGRSTCKNILPADEEEWKHASGLMTEFARRAVALGGTVSAEHGLGKRKRHLLEIQYSAANIEK